MLPRALHCLPFKRIRTSTINTATRYYAIKRTRGAKKPIAPELQTEHAQQEESDATNNPNAALQPPFQPPGSNGSFQITKSPSMDAAITTVIGITMVFLGGVVYFAWYKKNVLDKIEMAFERGYDPALELASHVRQPPDAGEPFEDDWTEHLRRAEQDEVDKIIKGHEAGKYYLLVGPKGSGKGTMVFDAMHAVEADGVAFCEAHPDLEVFRLRIGRALNFEYNEDTQTGLFQRRDPREGGPALDIERAMNKLEKVALRMSRKSGRPLVLIFNNVHLLKNDDDGRNILLQLQQRAETWAESGILTMVFLTDDFWPFLFLRKTANRMQILSITDLTPGAAITALRQMRKRAFPNQNADDLSVLKQVIKLTGGRLSFMSKVARSRNILHATHDLLENEKSWLLDHIGLIPDHDDDVMDEQKWSSCSWLLLQEFVKMRMEDEALQESQRKGSPIAESNQSLPLPSVPYWRCRQIMTRPDFLEGLDEKNIVSIDVHSNVRPDSELMLAAAREVVCSPGFEETLQNVRDRVDEIESLHRTRELTLKEISKLDDYATRVKRLDGRRS